MSGEFNVQGATLKVGGGTPLQDGSEYEHGHEMYVIARVVVEKLSFPQTKTGGIVRVHEAKAQDMSVVSPEKAERLIASEREKTNGQGNVIAELARLNGDHS